MGTHHFRGALLNGTPNGLFLDDPQFGPVLAQAEALSVPPADVAKLAYQNAGRLLKLG